MKRKISRIIGESIVVFIFNITAFLISLIFSDLTIIDCIVFTLFNTLWMTFLLMPGLEKMDIKIEKWKRKKHSLN